MLGEATPENFFSLVTAFGEFHLVIQGGVIRGEQAVIGYLRLPFSPVIQVTPSEAKRFADFIRDAAERAEHTQVL
jgi:hypothetical protein